MTTLNYTFKYKRTFLSSLIGICLSQSCWSLEALSDDVLSTTVGEGVALVPQDTYMIFQGQNSTPSDILDRSKDTGFIHVIPVGPLTNAAQDTNKNNIVDANDHSVGKADLYVYGLALSKSDGNHNSRFASNDSAAKISSWGTATNPWIFKVSTENQVPNFQLGKSCIAADVTCQVPYLTLEAPLYENNIPTSARDGADAYNLKLAMWADAFVLDQSKREGAADLYHLGAKAGQSDPNRANRLRLQAIWNGFSINGSRLQVFQTLGGATNTGGMSVFYNNTLGLTGLIRLNSGDSANVRTRTSDNKTLRLSTREMNVTDNLTTPALNGVGAPLFDSNEGLFFYNPNINLVLGSLYQPLVLSSDGRNFTIELARIPNKPEIYQKIYTDYSNPKSTTYAGSTCNVYQCGNNGLTGYQGNNATHSSISFGSTTYDPAKNTLSAYKGADAIGVSFGAQTPLPSQNISMPTNNFTNLGSAVVDGLMIQHLSITTKGL
ncbi:hypothetical protein G8E00_12400 [Acinetobacter shaoyimingii]|uniref:Signal peptide-containing protein n=1 Tax=Acinetobacter shaoyimingii TaxID=2715164 RepID=A0A6G8RXT3_9GAMM|nr:hypothetical protein [Acinetobacter shaoyimingii]NHB57611.1 hypothetical protein [Acinetobacter shaoyimingii]QIO06684.1 hypothetical protein G8E00_12400 [Acinetobacter shaoyimingii]